MTVAELTAIIIRIGSCLGALGLIVGAFTAVMNYLLKPIRTELKKNDVRQCRIFLVGFLCDVENGVPKDEVQFKLAHEIYDHYEKDLKENSYVHDKWERVMNNGNNE